MEGQYTRAYKRAPERIRSFLAAMDISGAQPDGELLHIIMTEDPDKKYKWAEEIVMANTNNEELTDEERNMRQMEIGEMAEIFDNMAVLAMTSRTVVAPAFLAP